MVRLLSFLIIFSYLYSGGSNTGRLINRRHSIAYPQSPIKTQSSLEPIHEKMQRSSLERAQDLESVTESTIPSDSLSDLQSSIDSLPMPRQSSKSEQDLLLALFNFEDIEKKIKKISQRDRNLEKKLTEVTRMLSIKFYDSPNNLETQKETTRLAIMILKKTEGERYFYPFIDSFMKTLSVIADKIFQKQYRGKGRQSDGANREIILMRVAQIYSELIQNAISLEEARSVAMTLLKDKSKTISVSALGLMSALVDAFDAQRKRYLRATKDYRQLEKNLFPLAYKELLNASEKLQDRKAYEILEQSTSKQTKIEEKLFLDSGAWQYILSVKIMEKLISNDFETFDEASNLIEKLSAGTNDFQHKASAKLTQTLLESMTKTRQWVTKEHMDKCYDATLKLFRIYQHNESPLKTNIVINSMKSFIRLANMHYKLKEMPIFAKEAYSSNSTNIKILGVSLFYQLLKTYHSRLKNRNEYVSQKLVKEAISMAQEALYTPKIHILLYEVAKETLEIAIDIAKTAMVIGEKTYDLSLSLYHATLFSYGAILRVLGKNLNEMKIQSASEEAFITPYPGQALHQRENLKTRVVLEKRINELSSGSYQSLKESAAKAANSILDKSQDTALIKMAKKVLAELAG